MSMSSWFAKWLAKLRGEQEIGSWKREGDGSYCAPAKGLYITDADTKNDNRYWKWNGDTAELRETWLVEIKAKFDTSKLTPRKKYQVFFVIELNDSASGWDAVVSMQLSFPDNPKMPQQLKFKDLPKKQDQLVLVDEFEASGDNKGMLDILLVQTDRHYKKTGLVVKGARIKPISE